VARAGDFDVRGTALAAFCLALGVLAGPVRALETDQFYAWDRSLADASGAINTYINAEIAKALAGANGRHDRAGCSCRTADDAIRGHFKYLIFPRPEQWTIKTTLVERIPASPDEEPEYRRLYLFGRTSRLDPVLWMPPSPTGHFFSDGPWIERSYRRAVKNGAPDDEAVREAVLFGVLTERTILGTSSSGIFSVADLEANYRGLQFYRGLCDGPHPALVQGPGGWRLERPFDIRDHVSPEWDESWEPNVYTRYRWKKVKPVMMRYCARLQDPEVRRRRSEYAARDRDTPTETIVRQLVSSGKLADPWQFSIEAVCAVVPSEAPPDSGR
jgi:hypothetical protein